ncbi:hypothetical protein SAMN06265795_103196 [Noviherbaspirillum humi]|uniref:Aspartate carbamoyltransferase n=1 Tax=Noviherbaspirillum humi TaxID=1688639 RepID=A0A239F7R7_9BURK|nr:aspartate carbamoyltransferase [Noviherbaspirillum humi]SNS52202.1 hypothetical protein SAMN06265795_103196 [Noviherbaspirillum humi]
MHRLHLPLLCALVLLAPAHAQHAHHPDGQRQAEVAQRGADVMPFDLAATTHVFTKTASGGIQRVIARRAGDAKQVRLVRAHLRDIQARFRRGDFSGPEHIHGAGMPGLATLKQARPGQVQVDYREVTGGAELAYRTGDAQLVHTIHAWFDAQLSDHGHDAVEGHAHR